MSQPMPGPQMPMPGPDARRCQENVPTCRHCRLPRSEYPGHWCLPEGAEREVWRPWDDPDFPELVAAMQSPAYVQMVRRIP